MQFLKYNIFQLHYLGTTSFLRYNSEFVRDGSLDGEIICNKDMGGLKTLQGWSRGTFLLLMLVGILSTGNLCTGMCLK